MKGSVIRRGRKWSVVVDVGRSADGKRIRRWHSGYDTKKDAQTAQAEILASLARGAYVSPTKLNLGEWLDIWLENRQGIADTTREGYGIDVNRLKNALGTVRLQDLTRALIASFYARMTDAGYSPKTVKNCHGVLHKALKDAVRDGLVARNPADNLELPPLERPETETWTADQLRAFLHHLKDHRLDAAWVVACFRQE